MYSNGWLPDDITTSEIKSVRRNPVVADVFQRMDYMERRGSGLRKICHETAIQDNYEPKFMPKFECDNNSFKVRLYDMNYQIEDMTNLVGAPLAPQGTPKSAPKSPPKLVC